MDFPKWQLHRGFWKEGIRENTMEAFRQAKLMECSMVELDVQRSRDGVLHVVHDWSLKRFFHVEQNVSQTKSEDLSGLNIPTLIEVLESDDVPKYLNIEVKSKGWWNYGISYELLKTLKDFNVNKKVLISSFNPMVLHWIKKLAPTVPRALIVGDPKVLRGRSFDWWMRLAEPHFINCHYKLIDDEYHRDLLLYYEKPLMVWTVNDHSKAQDYLRRGAASIISDLPPRL